MSSPRQNPYVVGQWVRGEKFFGRHELIDEILDGPRNSTWVIGTRRVGKTSLLKQLEFLTSPGDHPFVPIFWDFQGADNPTELNLSFEAATVPEILGMHRSTPAPDPRAVNPEVPGELAVLIRRCLAKNPADRLASGSEVEQSLRRIADGL